MSYIIFKNFFDFEKKSVFFTNFILVLMVVLFLLFNISLKFFFYIDIIITFILSYILFKKSKKVSKMLIITNMFIFFYFLYPSVSLFLTELFGSQSYVFILFYNVLIAYIFISLSGFRETFIGNFRKFNIPVFFLLILVGVVFGLLFTLIKEPIPSMFVDVFDQGFNKALFFLLGSSFVVAFSEQIIFSGFLFNVYKDLTSKRDAFIQVSTLFVMFHILRFQLLVEHYYVNFNQWYLLYITLYYIFLFLFMYTCLYFYSFKNKKYEGNFIYPVIIHFTADFSLFMFSMLGI